jgi:hypothetical protein
MNIILSVGLLLFSACIYAQDNVIPAEDTIQINKWLKENNQYRLANLRDCECDEQIQEVRKGDEVYKAVPNYLPYYASGNFGGLAGFAVIVVRKPFQAKIVVFTKNENFLPIVIESPLTREEDLKWTGLFVRPKNKKIDYLLIGAFNAEGEILDIPPRKKR